MVRPGDASSWDSFPDTPTSLPSAGLRRVLQVVSAATVVSGLVQLVAPRFVLGKVGASQSSTDKQLFATIGMFMTVIGALLYQELSDGNADQVVLLWAALQKFGAAGAVGIGVRRRVFARRALQVACFDFASGVLCLAYRNQVDRRAARS
jgi:hypothetical protein